jgi:hypothetical protein
MFKTILFELKSLIQNLKRNFLQPTLDFGPSLYQPTNFTFLVLISFPKSTHLAPGPFSLCGPPPTSSPSSGRLSRCRPFGRVACHHRSPSHARMEMNRSAARPPSLSRTSSTPRRLLSPIQCRNCRVKNPPPADPLPSPPPPPRGYKRPLSHHSTTPQLMPLLVSLLRASTCSTPSTAAEL